MPNFKCHFCKICAGKGCIGEIPGMGGPNKSQNCIENFAAWQKYQLPVSEAQQSTPPQIRLAPITGAVENVGYTDERQFYFDLLRSCADSGVPLSIGDGTPDEKLLFGLEALRSLKKKAAVFIKPYPDARFFERIDWSLDCAEFLGIDIDSYNIVTMRNLVHLEQKTSGQLCKIKEYLSKHGIPFVIKGIFSENDLKMIEEVKPDVAYVSNHGGRVDTHFGSTADFLAKNAKFLSSHCGQVWVDGGLRTQKQLLVAGALGADVALFARPFITALCRNKETGISEFVAEISK